ncbi:hypothetical protein M9Y10_016460 [Tritrichomonas musculus]|uniref:MMS19 nucleotide excision repair protein n=1 Tax=Tritrichomonas musculus TaxID=1915356 RepID=A0ABR2HW87_9EUKA
MSVEVTDNDVSRYLFLLQKNFEADNEARSQAETEINNDGAKDILKSTLIFSEIVLKDDIPLPLVYLALAWLKKIFTPVPPITEDQISTKWLVFDDQYRNKVKMAIFRGLMFPDTRIISMASLTFAALLNIEKIKMFDLISEIYKLIEQPGYSELTKAGAINVLAEISGPNSLGGHTDVEEVQSLLVDIFSHIGSYYFESLNKSIDIRYNIVYAINTFLDVADILFKGKDTVISLISLTIKNLENVPLEKPEGSIVTPGSFYDILLSVLFKVIKIHYDNNEFVPNEIFDYTIEKIMNFDPRSNESMAKISYLLQFWTSIAKYELKILKKCKFIKKMQDIYNEKFKNIKFNSYPSYPIYRGFSETAMKKIADKLFDIMRLINPNDPNSEDLSVRLPHMFATCCLQVFFKIDPYGIFDCFKKNWFEVLIKYYEEISKQKKNASSEEFTPPPPLIWIQDHTLLLTVSIICRKIDFSMLNDFTMKLKSFFFDPFGGENSNYCILKDYVIGTCLIFNPIPKITDTCLFSLSKIFRRYPSFLKKEIFGLIFGWIKNNMTTNDPIIFLRILSLITTICSHKVFPFVHEDVQKDLLDNFSEFVKLFHIGVARQDAMISDIYRLSYIMMSSVAFAAIYKGSCGDEIKGLISSELTKLDELSTTNIDTYNYTKISQIINLFNTIFKYTAEIRYLQDWFLPVVNGYSKLLSPNSPIFEESLRGLCIVVRNLDRNEDNILIKVNQKVNDALNSNSPSIITTASYMRASLYEKFIKKKLPGYQELLNEFPSNYKWIINGCLSNTYFTREFYPLLLKSLALLISSCSEDIKNNHPEIIEDFLNQFNKYVKSPIEIRKDNKNDIEYANLFYEAMFAFARSIMECLPQDSQYVENRKLYQLLMVPLPKGYFDKLEFNFSDTSLLQFIEFLNQYNETFGTVGNIVLHRRVNFQILIHGMCSEKKYLEERALPVFEMIKKA